jgi:proteasome lid subunit RPN8/RPN11
MRQVFDRHTVGTTRSLHLALAMCTFAACSAEAARCDPTIVLGPLHASAEEAAMQALAPVLGADADYESGGYVVAVDQGYRATRAVTQRRRDRVDYCIVLPRRATLAGIYHSHVGTPRLSGADIDNARRAGVPSFVGSVRYGSIVAYDPARDDYKRIRSRRDDGPVLSAAPSSLQRALRSTRRFGASLWSRIVAALTEERRSR